MPAELRREGVARLVFDGKGVRSSSSGGGNMQEGGGVRMVSGWEEIPSVVLMDPPVTTD